MLFYGQTFAVGSTLDGAVFDSTATFFDCEFAGGVDISGTVFRRRCSFHDARFIGPAYFSKATFAEGATFTGAAFEGAATFQHTTWTGHGEPALFDTTHFAGPLDFDDTKFGTSLLSLTDARCDGPVSFAGTSHEANWRLERTQFGGELVLGDGAPGPPVVVVLSNVRWADAAAIQLAGASVMLDRCTIDSPLTIVGTPTQRSATDVRNELFAARPTPVTPSVAILIAEVEAKVKAEPAQPPSPVGALAGIVGCTITAPVTVDVPVDEHVRFVGSSGLEQVRFPSNWSDLLARRGGRRVLTDEARLIEEHPAAVEGVYRQLRVGLEASKAAPAAADFYMGEMEARRKHAAGLDRSLLWVYRRVGGYGVRSVPPLAWFCALILATTFAFRYRTDWFVRQPDQPTVDGFELDRFWDVFAFVVKNSISLFSAPAGGLTAAGTVLLIVERYSAVALLALVVFAIRSRVAR